MWNIKAVMPKRNKICAQVSQASLYKKKFAADMINAECLAAPSFSEMLSDERCL
jgi:hypothetical protein